jgi:hypothetical protein
MDYTNRIYEHVNEANGSVAGLYSAITRDDGGVKADWPVRRALATAQVCDLIITPDSGVAWAVASEPMPKIMLLSHASERNITYGWTNTVTLKANPELVKCHPCHRLHERIETCTPNETRTGALCISSISVESIISESRRLLSEGRSQDSGVTPDLSDLIDN